MSFFAELKRRNVFRVCIAYLITAWLLMQVADILLETFKAPEWAMQFIVVLLVIGFFLTLFFSWAFELTSEGIKLEKGVDRTHSITTQTGRKLNQAILLLMALAIVYLLFDKFSAPDPMVSPPGTIAETAEQPTTTPVAESEPEISRQSIAVLPFENRSNREEDQFFTDGIHDELLTTIAKIGSMKVISRTSMMEYRGTTRKIPEIADELGVAHILAGGIQRSGGQVRINVQLIDARTDEHLWAEIYDRELTVDNLFSIQSEISNAIAEALQTTLSPTEQRRIDVTPTDNLQAYNYYLEARQLVTTRNSAKLEQARELFTRAVELDPEFALAWVGVSDSNMLVSWYGTLDQGEAAVVMEDAVNHALAIDGDLGQAYASLGSLHLRREEYTEAEQAYQRAIELNPNYARAYHWYADLLLQYPLRIQERLQLARKAAELDPRSSVIALVLGHAYLNTGLHSMAKRQYEKIIELSPEFPSAWGSLADYHLLIDTQLDQSYQYAMKYQQMDPGNLRPLYDLVQVFLELDDHQSALRIRDRMVELDPDHLWVRVVDVELNLARANSAGTREAIQWVLSMREAPSLVTQYMADIAMNVGDYELARKLYRETASDWFDPGGWQSLLEQDAMQGCTVAWTMMNTGDQEMGSRLLQQAIRFFEEILPSVRKHVDIFNLPFCYLAAGETDKALKVFETQLQHNHLSGWWWAQQMDLFDQVRFEPRFLAVAEERIQRLNRQTRALREIQANSSL